MTTLALDLGTKCGWAVGSEGQPHSGVWKLQPGKRDCDRTRELVLARHLDDALRLHGVTRIAYERVDSHGRLGRTRCKLCGGLTPVRLENTVAAHVYGALAGVVELVADMHRLEVVTVPVGTLKKHATGKGNAKKDAMIAAAQERWGDNITDDNQADALWVLDWSRSH